MQVPAIGTLRACCAGYVVDYVLSLRNTDSFHCHVGQQQQSRTALLSIDEALLASGADIGWSRQQG